MQKAIRYSVIVGIPASRMLLIAYKSMEWIQK
jgi:hypothetical protein